MSEQMLAFAFLVLSIIITVFYFPISRGKQPPPPPFMAADWTQLPKDLLQFISEKLNSEFYQLRFRSVCSSWRSSVPKNHHHHLNLPSKFPTPSNSNNIDDHSNSNSNNNNASTFPLSKRTLFLITPPPNQQTLQPWLIKIGPDSHDLIHLWHPLSRDKQFPLHSPHVIDFNHLSVIDLGREFVIGQFPSQSPLFINDNTSLYMEKLVVYDTCHSGNENDPCSVLLTIHVSGKLAIFRCGDEQWTIIPEMPTMFYDDVCVFNGRPIAVDGTGRTVAVEPDLSLDLVAEAEAVFGGDKKFLVESDGELLLVDKYLSCLGNYSLDDGETGNDIVAERAVKFDVFRLDEKEKKWVEVRNLGDRVLFLGEDCVFSSKCNGNGNCVIFMDRNCHSTEFGISVFHLDQRRISPLSDFPCYSKLFWPPPEWVGLRVDNNRALILD
ncbi:F-box family protein [Trifolium pratense]|uniref:F-box family protein n=1 Tax=Trifolium pratense TaxID=57577 RepID=A0A2K3NMJ9_TRIPR|nr:F-box family protein [Trifolium pratense]